MISSGFLRHRWLQLALGILAMIMIANLQYSWTLFVQPLQDAHGWKKASIQGAFTLFVLFQTWLVPVNGWLVDRFGPRPFVVLAGVLVGASWLIFAHADTLGMLYFGSILAGIGAGCVYGTMVGSAVKWFPDKRGLAVGLTAAGFGAGAALTVLPINAMIHTSGYASAFSLFGWIQGIALVVIALFLAFPQPGNVPATSVRVRQTSHNRTPAQMLASPVFYIMYLMFVMIATGLVFITAQVAPMAKDYGVDKAPLDIFGFVVLALPFALVVDNVLNGGSRAIFGALSDRIGREKTMSIAFSIEAVALIGLIFAAHNPWLFVACAGATFVAAGEIYSLFPATCTDLFGTRYASTNAGLLYTAKGTAALVVPLASSIHDSTGSWTSILTVLVAFNVITALLAFLVLKPMRERTLAREHGEALALDPALATAN